jgi:hypothetical protein
MDPETLAQTYGPRYSVDEILKRASGKDAREGKGGESSTTVC